MQALNSMLIPLSPVDKSNLRFYAFRLAKPQPRHGPPPVPLRSFDVLAHPALASYGAKTSSNNGESRNAERLPVLVNCCRY